MTGASVPDQALSASPTEPLRVSSLPGNDPAREQVASAIKATEYKYFGVYELSDDQLAAVDVLVEAAVRYLTLVVSSDPMPKPSPCLDNPLRVAGNMRQAGLPGAAEALEWAEWQRQYAIRWANQSVDSVKERMWAAESCLAALVEYLSQTPHHNAPEAAAARKLLNRVSDASLAEDGGTAAEPRSGGSPDPKGNAQTPAQPPVNSGQPS